MLTTSIKVLKAFISDLSAYGNKSVTFFFKPSRMQKRANISLRSSVGCCGQLEVALCHGRFLLLGKRWGAKTASGQLSPVAG